MEMGEKNETEISCELSRRKNTKTPRKRQLNKNYTEKLNNLRGTVSKNFS